ncbi:MAG: ATPase/protein kinase [Rhodothermaceae bacterium]|nr:MAG: ATPase/protein kinase [Rhodothermaceae bacterium]
MTNPHPPSATNKALRVQEGVPEPPSINPGLRAGRGRTWSVEAIVEGLRTGSRVALARAITLIESTRPEHRAQARAVVEQCLPLAGRSLRIGITGAPGAGKSTLIEALGTRLTAAGHRLAVLAIDPTSERSKGSILGDKTRMPRLATDENAFIRPSPAGGSLGGVARTTRETILLCEAAGYDLIFIETVGVGQSETTVHSMVDFFLVLVLAGAGDELQGLKRGLIEMADAVVVTKADGDNVRAARLAQGQYQSALRLFPPLPSGWKPPVLTCSARTGEGLEALWQTIQTYREQAIASGYFEENRRRQAREWMLQTIEYRLREHFFNHPGVRAALAGLEAEVLEGRTSPFTAAEKLLALYAARETP